MVLLIVQLYFTEQYFFLFSFYVPCVLENLLSQLSQQKKKNTELYCHFYDVPQKKNGKRNKKQNNRTLTHNTHFSRCTNFQFFLFFSFYCFHYRNLARSSTIMISPDFIITKNKLYRSFSE